MVQRDVHALVGSQQGVAGHVSHEHVRDQEHGPLGHVLHHMGRWTSQLCVPKMVEVLNMKTLARVSDARAVAQERRVARATPRLRSRSEGALRHGHAVVSNPV